MEQFPGNDGDQVRGTLPSQSKGLRGLDKFFKPLRNAFMLTEQRPNSSHSLFDAQSTREGKESFFNSTRDTFTLQKQLLWPMVGPQRHPRDVKPGVTVHVFFMDSKSRCNDERSKGQSANWGHVRDAEGRSAGLPLTLNFPPCLPQKKEKASVKVSVIAPGRKHASRGSRRQSPCNPISWQS